MPVGVTFSSLGHGLGRSTLVPLGCMELGAWPQSPEMRKGEEAMD